MTHKQNSLKLYRFLNFEGTVLTLASGKLKVGRWNKFNDPFDFSFGFDPNFHLTENDKKAVVESFLSNLRDKFGAICFSGEWEHRDEKIPIWSDPLGWGHYTDNHRGAVLEFSADIADGFWKDHLWKIDYSDCRPQFPAAGTGLNPDGALALRKAGQTKSSAWKHENETRLIVPLDADSLTTSEGDVFLPITEGFLTKIILGFRSPLDKEDVRKLIVGKPYQDVPIQRTSMSISEYRMEVD